jgi:catechol 2,3-dioxygenase-like lactoylglutathione lyase family enzyme
VIAGATVAEPATAIAIAAEMGRVQLALNVTDLDEAIDFYSKLFQTEPAKRRPGYANFAVADPPLKLVLFENPAQAGTLNHLGVEVGTADEVVTATRRLAAAGLPTEVEDGVTCCHALQDKVWVAGADSRWEVYTVLADAPAVDDTVATQGCCGNAASDAAASVCCSATASSAGSGADVTQTLSA